MCSQVLPCPLCCKANFESVDALKISLVKVTNRPLVCPICSEMLFGLDKLTIHLFSHSLAMDVDQEDRIEGPVTVNPTPSSPSTVSPTSPRSSAKEPKRHTIKEPSTPPPPSSVRCEICDFVFDNQKHLSMHQKLVHVVAPSSTSAAVTPETVKLFPCHLCNKSFKMKGSLRVHLRVVHSHGFQNLCKDAASKNKDDDPQPLSSGNEETSGGTKCASAEGEQSMRRKDGSGTSPDQSKAWICDICTKSFTTKYFLKKHKRLHTGEMPYACSICGKTFTFQQSYHKHLLYHSDEKPHVCGTCGRAFKELSTLHNHERIHSGEKPFKCETCGKCFRQRVSYLVHRRIHDGTMPYQCTACAKSFRYKVSQRTHKCPAQPPGQVVRQSGELLQKLLQNSTLIETDQVQGQQKSHDEEETSRLEAEERHRINELIDKSIEDMARGQVTHIDELFPTPVVEEILGIPSENSLNSPSEQFQNLCLYSQDHSLDSFSEQSIKDLLYPGSL